MHAFSIFLESCENTNCASVDGGVNVFVLLMDWYVSRLTVAISLVTSPCNSFHSSTYGLETRARTHASSLRANWSAVCTPYFPRSAAVLGPIPHNFTQGVSVRNFSASRSGITVSPSGFFHFEPIFASVFVAESPMEKVMPSSRSRSFFIASAISGYDIFNVRLIPVKSAKHSSIEYSSTAGVYRRTISYIRCENKLYVS